MDKEEKEIINFELQTNTAKDLTKFVMYETAAQLLQFFYNFKKKDSQKFNDYFNEMGIFLKEQSGIIPYNSNMINFITKRLSNVLSAEEMHTTDVDYIYSVLKWIEHSENGAWDKLKEQIYNEWISRYSPHTYDKNPTDSIPAKDL